MPPSTAIFPAAIWHLPGGNLPFLWQRRSAALMCRPAAAPHFSNCLIVRAGQRTYWFAAFGGMSACSAHAFRNMTEMLLLEPDSIRETFREWHAERESLDAQLAESLSALSAYQSHLDTWQQELAQKRDELRKAREQFDADQAAAEKSKAHLEGLTVEVSDLRDKISSLNVSLTDRTEELHAQAKRRDELVAELEASRAEKKSFRQPWRNARGLTSLSVKNGKRSSARFATRRHAVDWRPPMGARPPAPLPAGAVRSCCAKWRRFAGRQPSSRIDRTAVWQAAAAACHRPRGPETTR